MIEFGFMQKYLFKGITKIVASKFMLKFSQKNAEMKV